MSTKAKTRPDRKRTDLSDNSYERRFFELLGNLFIGVPIEGKSGYVNLMRIKSQYYRQVMQPAIQQYVQEQTADFPDYREDLFTKLYTFLKRYIHSETGSLGLFFTPYHESVYERVYTDDRDVMLFWKTSRLYYVKTDILFRSMDVEIGGYKFHFDASQVEHKRNNEKRKLEYRLAGTNGSDIRLTVHYQEASRRRQDETSGDEPSHSTVKDLLAELRSHGLSLTEEVLEQAIRQFEKQSQVDFFICKDAKSFLREQFDLWMWQYLLGSPGSEPDPGLDQEDLCKLQALKRVAYRVIDFIAAFEDELVKIWNKPKFVLNSNYVITIDRIWSRSQDTVRRLLEHPGMGEQVQEWRELGMVDEGFQPAQIVQSGNLIDELHPRYRFLPIDTRYFKDVELEILGLFDHLDEELDGWLIKSENYQALNTILPKWRGKVKCIYIDPPFNKEQEADYHYSVDYKDSTWATLLENRLSLARELLSTDGHLFVRCDHCGNFIVRGLLNLLFGPSNFRNEIVVKRGASKAGLMGQFQGIRSLAVGYDNVYWYTKEERTRVPGFYREVQGKRRTQGSWTDFQKGEMYDRPTMRYEILGISIDSGQWKWSKDRAMQAVENYQRYLQESAQTGESLEQYWLRHGCTMEFIRREGNKIKYWVHPRNSELIDNVWLDIPGYDSRWGFSTENAEALLLRVIHHVTAPGDTVLDFFLGSGTTIAVAHKLRRKWIGIELGEHYYTVVLPRMKHVLFGDPGGASRYPEIAEQYGPDNAGGFFKYFELEQYEQTLRRCQYNESGLMLDQLSHVLTYQTKLLDAVRMGTTVSLELDAIYDGVDLLETVSLLKGIPIRSMSHDGLVLENGQDIRRMDPRELLPVLWWS